MVMTAPIIPGLNDSEIPAILKQSREAGAKYAGYVLLRLPSTVQAVFLDWLHRCRPNQAAKVEAFVRDTRGGKLYKSTWRERQRGVGAIADQIGQTFRVFARRYDLDRDAPPLNCDAFRSPAPSTGQLSLF